MVDQLVRLSTRSRWAQSAARKVFTIGLPLIIRFWFEVLHKLPFICGPVIEVSYNKFAGVSTGVLPTGSGEL